MTYESTLTLPIPHPVETLKAQVEALIAHDVSPAEYREDMARYETEYGHLTTSVIPEGWSIQVLSDSENGLEILKNFIIEHILEHYKDVPEEILVWKGYESQGNYPANFRLVTVIDKKSINPNMIRVTVKGESLASYAEKSIHFQLLIPSNPDLSALWPTKKASGKIHYPPVECDKDQGLYRRVYTIRNIRVEQDEFDFDVLRHEGGIASDWAETVSIGDEVGVIGPSGGYYPKAEWLMLAGDETALPAIARILENSPTETKGEVFIVLKEEGDWRISLDKPDGINIHWLYQTKDNILDEIQSLSIPKDMSTYFWFGGEQKVAAALRTYFKSDLGLDSNQFHSSAYWKVE